MSSKYERISPAIFRVAVAQSQVDGCCSDALAEFVLRIHDIVKKQCAFFKSCTAEELEEATSWSIERWISKGIQRVDLEKYDNPFSYFWRGSAQNMMNRVLQLRRKEQRKLEYEKMMKEMAEVEMPSLQNKDLTSLYG